MILQPFTAINAAGHVQARGAMPDPVGTYGSDVILDYAPDNTYWDGTGWSPLKDFDDFNTLTVNPIDPAAVIDTIIYGTALPNPTYIFVNCDNPRFIPLTTGEASLVTDGTLNLSLLAVGEYKIRLWADQYMEKIMTVSVA